MLYRFTIAALVGVLLAACSSSRGLVAPAAVDVEAGAASVLQPYIDRGELPGAVVLVTSRTKVLEFSALGQADIGKKLPMQKESLFWIASTSKPFVGVLVMMLVEEGKIALDERVTTYLPSFTPTLPGGETTELARNITVRQLLTHTSGLPGRLPVEAPTLDLLPLAERVEGYGKAKLLAQPDAAFIYGNADVNTVARIIEVVIGDSYENVLERRVLRPLGMRETTFCPTPRSLEKLVKAYSLDASDKLVETPIPSLAYPLSECEKRYPVPAGGLFSNARDMSRFAEMLLSGGILDGRRYLSAASIAEMTRSQLRESVRQKIPGSEPPLQVSYGLAWGASLDGSYFHPGSFMTDVRVDPTHTVATILLFQLNGGKSYDMREALLKESDNRYTSRAGQTP
jgi:CubicO group peptidase (beta-lactamase class C family)